MTHTEAQAAVSGALESPFDIIVEPSGPLGGYVRVPPSKNYTTRLVLAASLAEGRSIIHRPAANDDARALVRCCRALGAKITEQADSLEIQGVAGHPKNPGVLNPDNAGAVLRMLLGTACLVEGEVRFETDHAESLGRRPNRELLAALSELGAETEAANEEGTLPITIHGDRSRLQATEVAVDCSRSSQYLSSILFLTPHLDHPTRVRVAGPTGVARVAGNPVLVSRPLIDQTLEVLGRFGADVEASADRFSFEVAGSQTLAAGEQTVNGDWPSAAALLSAVAAAGGMASLEGLSEDAQGERRARDAFEAMGCKFASEQAGQFYVHATGGLRAIEFDGDLATDAVLAIEAAACLAEGTTRLTGIGNLTLKETDRIGVPLQELARIGVRARSGSDWIEIDGNPEGYKGGITVDCRGDHRIAQMLAIVATRCERGLRLRGAECVSKSYPGFFEDLSRLGVKLHRVAPES